MTAPLNKPTRWRPRFSVRTLVVIVTAVCAYAACWGPTKKRGVADVMNRVGEEQYGYRLDHEQSGILSSFYALAPLVIAVEKSGDGSGVVFTSYYVWFFGSVVKVPYERQVSFGEAKMISRAKRANS